MYPLAPHCYVAFPIT